MRHRIPCTLNSGLYLCKFVTYNMRMKRRLWGILFLFFSAMMFAQTDFPSLEPLFLYEPAEDVLSGEDVIRAGLEFSLCPAEAGAAVIERY